MAAAQQDDDLQNLQDLQGAMEVMIAEAEQQEGVQAIAPAAVAVADIPELLPLEPVPMEQEEDLGPAQDWELPHPHAGERARRSAMNQRNFPNLVPIATYLLPKIKTLGQRMRLLRTCRLFYYHMPPVDTDNDENNLKNLGINLIRNQPQPAAIQIQVNNRSTTMPMTDVKNFLDLISRIFSKRMDQLTLTGNWPDPKYYSEDQYSVGMNADVAYLWETLCAHFRAHAEPKGLEIFVGAQTCNELTNFFANAQFTRRLERAGIIYRSGNSPISMATAVATSLLTLAETKPDIALTNLHLHDKSSHVRLQNLDHNIRPLYRDALWTALERFDLRELTSLNMNTLIGWGDDDLHEVLQRTSNLRELSIKSRQNTFDFTNIFDRIEFAMTQRLVHLDLDFTIPESNMLVVSLPIRCPNVKLCHLKLHNLPGELVLGHEDFHEQTEQLLVNVITMVEGFFEHNTNDRMELRVITQGINNRRIAQDLSNDDYIHLHVACIILHGEGWLFKMVRRQAEGVPTERQGIPVEEDDGKSEYVRRQGTVRIKLKGHW